MKRISILMLAVCSTLAFGQKKVSDFKYVSVPEKFGTFREDYGLKNFLIKALTGKKYVILPAAREEWPEEARANSCNVLDADIQDDKGLFRNKLILQFKDCNKNMVLESKGSSSIKEFEEGLQDALKQALVPVGVSSPVAMLPAQTSVSETRVVQTSVSETVTSSSSTASGTSNFSNGKMDLQKIQIDGNQFILAKAGSSVPFANFKSTSKKDVFIVKLENGTTTIGYFENGNIVMDMPQGDGKYVKEVFSGK